MIRRWAIQPDQAYETPDGPIGIVSEQALAKSLYDATIMLHRAGGVLSVVLKRADGEIPGEMVTVGGIVEWKDRTDGRAAPEQKSEPVRLEAPDDDDVLAAVVAATDAPEPSEVEVDETDVPEHLRATV